MFKQYKDICDVVSLLVYCPAEKAYLLSRDANGEFWIPSNQAEKNCWKVTAHKLNYELFGTDAGPQSQCVPLRVYRAWLPGHPTGCAFHVVFKVIVKPEIKRRTKMKTGSRSRLQWLNSTELERQRVHAALRSPEVAALALMAAGESKEELQEMETGLLIEICESSVLVTGEVAAGAGAVALASPNLQLLAAAGYQRDDQIRLYREFVLMVYPAVYMSLNTFTQFMLELGWQKSQCSSLFRAADITGRGGLSFSELMLWSAALEPGTQHSGMPAEIRCRYIFRYFDTNRDQKLEYVEFKELVAAARAARQLPADALSVARDADACLRQLGMQPNTQLPLAEFLRGVGELRLRGTSSLLRCPRSISGYLLDLSEREKELAEPSGGAGALSHATSTEGPRIPGAVQTEKGRWSAGVASATRRATPAPARPDYSVAAYTVKLNNRNATEMLELGNFDDDTVSPSTLRLVAGLATSTTVLGPTSDPVEALAAVHYFATAVNIPSKKTGSGLVTAAISKPALAWQAASEEAALGALLLRLAEPARRLCAAEPRLLRLASPLIAVGDLHGNLPALLSMEAALWPAGAALCPAGVLFLGDYVDRGAHGTELMAYLLAAKIQRPHAVHMIRGNHETRDIQKMFTFYNECIAKYGESDGLKIWNAINNVFDVLPLAAVVDDKVFCCHGGIPPPWVCPLITAIDKIPVPLLRPAEQSSIAWELLWNDPVKQRKLTASLALELAANEGFAANAKRGTGHVFDQQALDRFLLANQLSHVVRAHELHQLGFMCQLRGRLVSVFSSYHYCGGSNESGVALLEGGKLRLIRLNAE